MSSGAQPEAGQAGTGATAKDHQLEPRRVRTEDTRLTTEQGVRVDHTDDALTVGERGPTLLEDFHAREKITQFDHERIPERVVHARGAGAYGNFRPYSDWLAEYTVAEFLTNPDVETPTFTRFSTVAGSRGSADTVRDVRGFATKFYTTQGNYDLVGNNMPVFFIQDGIKFPDFVHAVKPEPDREIPQAQSAHDTFWDFVSLQPESLHMVMWLMSDRALPRSYRMMQGFGVHTFRLVNADGRSTFVKFHWTPRLGTHSLVWDEAQKIQGKDPDFNRRDLWDAIEAGSYPEFELGVQLVPEEDEFAFDFDLLDPTKIIPEEDVPVRPVGRLVLNRNPDNFFAETEQIAFHTANADAKVVLLGEMPGDDREDREGEPFVGPAAAGSSPRRSTRSESSAPPPMSRTSSSTSSSASGVSAGFTRRPTAPRSSPAGRGSSPSSISCSRR